MSIRSAAAQTDEASCRAALAAYQAKPTVAALEPLFPCIDDSKPQLRALILDKIVCREVWSDPRFNRDLVARLRAVIKKYDRGSAVYDPAKDTMESLEVSKFAGGMDMWLWNWEHYIDPAVLAQQRREDRAHQDKMAYYDRRIKWNTARILIFGGIYLVSLIGSTMRSRRLRQQRRQQGNLPPGVDVS